MCAGQWPAAVCESRPSQGQAEPLCYPLLPCVPPGFFPPFSSLGFFFSVFFERGSDFVEAVLFCLTPLPPLLPLVRSPLRKTKTGWKNSHHLLLSELLTMQIPSLSSSALPSLSLLSPPSLSLSLSATVGEELSHFSLFLLPLSCPSSNSNSYLVSHFSTCFETERRGSRQTWREVCCLSVGMCKNVHVCHCDGGGLFFISKKPHIHTIHACVCLCTVRGVHLHSQICKKAQFLTCKSAHLRLCMCVCRSNSRSDCVCVCVRVRPCAPARSFH